MSVLGEKEEETNVYGTPEERAASQRRQDQKLEQVGNYFELPYLSSESYEDNKRLAASGQGVSGVSGRTESSGRTSPNQNAGKTPQQTMDEINNMSPSTRKTIEDMRDKLSGNNNVADNADSIANTSNSNNSSITLNPGGILSAMNSKFASEKADALSKADDSFKTKKSNAPTLMKQNNEISSSRKRGGLFGNYGKQVEIKKTFNKSTGRTNKQKFVDGELFSDRNSRQDVRRAGRNAASNKRTNRKAGRNK